MNGAISMMAAVKPNSNEMTLAKLVQQKGYATAIVGKWHLERVLKPMNCDLGQPAQHHTDHHKVQQTLGVELAGVGTLAGFDTSGGDVSRTGTVTLTLYWRADDTPATADDARTWPPSPGQPGSRNARARRSWQRDSVPTPLAPSKRCWPPSRHQARFRGDWERGV